MLYAHSHTFLNSPPLRSRLMPSPPGLARRLNAAPGARGEVSPCPSLPLPTPFRALTGAPSPIRPPKGGSLGVTRTSPRPPAPWRNPPAHPLRRLTAAPPPSAPQKGAPWGMPFRALHARFSIFKCLIVISSVAFRSIIICGRMALRSSAPRAPV